MKSTFIIADEVMVRLKREAARRKTTMSALVEAGLRMVLEEERPPAALAPLPRFEGGVARVDVADREALHDLMDDR